MQMAPIAVFLGAGLGALLRWGLSNHLNDLSDWLPLGTLTANCLGAYLMGIAAGFFMLHPQWSVYAKLLIMTGFLGGLTTFSTFSLETVTLMQNGLYSKALLLCVMHLSGSFLLTILGFLSYSKLQAAF